MLASGNTPAMIPRPDRFSRDTIPRAENRRNAALMNSEHTRTKIAEHPRSRHVESGVAGAISAEGS